MTFAFFTSISALPNSNALFSFIKNIQCAGSVFHFFFAYGFLEI